jgi:hypothetical protein
MAFSRTKGPGRTVTEVATQIEALVREIGGEGVWHASP